MNPAGVCYPETVVQFMMAKLESKGHSCGINVRGLVNIYSPFQF